MVIVKTVRGFRKHPWIVFIIFALFLTTSIAGCETSGPKYNTAKSAIAPLADREGRIVFYRPGSFLWYGYRDRPDIFLNDEKVGVSRPGTVFHVDVERGRHRVTIPAALYTGYVTIDVDVSEGETVYVKNNMGVSIFAGKVKIEVVTPEQAISEIDGLEYMAHPVR